MGGRLLAPAARVLTALHSPDTLAAVEYWATLEAKRCAEEALRRHAEAQARLARAGQTRRARALLAGYYGRGVTGAADRHSLVEGGEDGETLEWEPNVIRTVVTHAVSLVAGQHPEVRPVAVNGDATSLARTRLAARLHEYYETQTGGRDVLVECVRGGFLAGSWTVALAWAPKDGREWGVHPETGQPMYEGDVRHLSLPSWRCTWDDTAADVGARKWVAFRVRASRWELAAQLEATKPEVARKLRATSPASSQHDATVAPYLAGTESYGRVLDSLLGETLGDDSVWVWEVRHVPSPACPRGRLLRFVAPDMVVWDSAEVGVAYPYSSLAAHEYCPERVVGAHAGHTAASDTLAAQQVLALCATAMATTVNIGGQMHLWAPSGAGAPQVRHLSTGNTILESSQPPQPIEYPALRPELLQAAEWAMARAREALALNDVVVGAPPKGMPASAQALQRAQAVAYHQVAQGAYYRLVQDVATTRLQLLRDFARSPRVTRLAGEDSAYEVREWRAEDLEGVDGFVVRPVAPGTSSLEARQAMAEMLGQLGQLKPEGLWRFLQTGNLEAAMRDRTHDDECVEATVSLVMQGVGPPMVDAEASMQAGAPVYVEDGQRHVRLLRTDPHHLLVPALRGVLASPAAREDAAVVRAATECIALSLSLWRSLTPDEAHAYGIPPLPSQVAGVAQPPPAPPGKTPGAKAPPAPSPDADEAPAPASGMPSPPPGSGLTAEDTGL